MGVIGVVDLFRPVILLMAVGVHVLVPAAGGPGLVPIRRQTAVEPIALVPLIAILNVVLLPEDGPFLERVPDHAAGGLKSEAVPILRHTAAEPIALVPEVKIAILKPAGRGGRS